MQIFKGSPKNKPQSLLFSDKTFPKTRGINNLLKERNLNVDSNDQFVKIYKEDPFFRAKIDYNLQQMAKVKQNMELQMQKMSLNPRGLQNKENKSLIQKRFLDDQRFIDQCQRYHEIVSKI